MEEEDYLKLFNVIIIIIWRINHFSHSPYVHADLIYLQADTSRGASAALSLQRDHNTGAVERPFPHTV